MDKKPEIKENVLLKLKSGKIVAGFWNGGGWNFLLDKFEGSVVVAWRRIFKFDANEWEKA